MKRKPIPIMIDSGAFSAWTRKKVINLDDYIGFLHTVLKDDPTIEYINLDVIGDGRASYQNWKTMREAGLNPLPVYHVITDIKWLKRYLRQTDYIGIGAIAKMYTSERTLALDRIWEDYLIDKNRMPIAKIHGMGITSFPLVKRYPWYSIDSTAWLKAGMYGKIFLPHRQAGVWVYNKRPFAITFSTRSPARSVKNKHIETMGPIQRQILLDYLKFTGYEYGTSRWVEGKEKVVIPGVSNMWSYRCFLNALFFSKYLKSLEWPRPFLIKRPKGLLQ